MRGLSPESLDSDASFLERGTLETWKVHQKGILFGPG